MILKNTAPKFMTALLAILLASTFSFSDDADPAFTRSEVEISVPDVTLIDQNGNEVRLGKLLESDKPVFVDFIFATCTTICPILSAGYSSVQRKLGDSRSSVDLISITIDPEHDGPKELLSYLKRYRAKPGWRFLTGTRNDIEKVMRSFGAYVADKMSHRPLVYIKTPGSGTHWIQLRGFAGSSDLIHELRVASGESEHVARGGER